MHLSSVLVFRLLPLAIAWSVVAHAADGQTIRGTVHTDDSVAVPGVVVLLVNDAGITVVRTLGDARGTFVLRAPGPGRYALRTLRLGYRPVTTSSMSLGAGQDTTATLRLARVPVVLERVVVQARRACRTRTSPGAVAALWNAAQTALEGYRTTLATRHYTVRIITSQRRMAPDAKTLLVEQRQTREGTTVRPFGSLPADSLEKVGYVTVTPSGDGATAETIYRGPDAEVLLSPEFGDSHCFDLAASTDPDQRLVGLTFRPRRTPRANGIVDVEGTLWLDRFTSELRRIDYLYAGLPPESRDHARGTIEYAALPDGGWVLRRWAIHMPVLELRMIQTADRSVMRTRRERRPVVAGVEVSAGEVQEVRSGAQVVWTSRTASLAGHLGSPVGSVVLRRIDPIDGSSQAVRVDPSGAFRIDSLAPGPHSVTVTDTTLDPLRLATDTVRFTIAEPGQRAELTVAPPGVHQVLRRLCGASAPDTTTRAVIGTVRSPTGALLPNVEVRATFLSRVQRTAGERLSARTESRATRTDASGRFLLCGVSGERPVQLRASAGESVGTVSTTRPDPAKPYTAVTLELDPRRSP